MWETRLTVREEREFNPRRPDYSPRRQICTLHRHGPRLFLPFARAIEMGFRSSRLPIPHAASWPPFRITLRDEQETILRESLQHLKTHHSLLLAVYPGGGKTLTTIRICRALGHATLVIVNRLVLMEQWQKSIERALGKDSRLVQCVRANRPILPGRLFYIVNAINVPKFEERVWRETVGIGTVVVDECHLIMTKVFVQSLGCVAPRYLIGLSATPYRHDGMDELFEIYFAASKTRIYRPLRRHHVVYCLTTPLVFPSEYAADGRLLWNRILDAQAFHPQRLRWIARLCELHADRRILILGKRVDALRSLAGQIPDSAVFTGTQTAFDESARVLVSTFSKVGTGFSHDCLDMLILANDAEDYFLQYLGRVFRRPDVVPVVMDIVDRHPVLQNHFRTRRKVYAETGGVLESTPVFWEDILRESPPPVEVESI